MIDKYHGTYLIFGPPGTGKTTFLARQVRAIAEECEPGEEPPLLLVSLTKAAARELSGRDMPIPRKRIGTLHAHAYRAFRSPPLIGKHLSEWCEYCPRYAMTGVEGGTEGDLDDLGDAEKPNGVTPGLFAAYNLNRQRMTPRALWSVSVQSFATQWEAWKSETGYMDFTDLIERAINELPLPPYGARVIIADEAQDLSRLEYTLLTTWARNAQALLLAGDPWQSLYTWRGADPAIFYDASVPDDHRRVLGQSYRVPQRVQSVALRAARGLSDYSPIEYKPRDDHGEVGVLDATWKSPLPLVQRVRRHLDAGQSVMVLATCGYMLSPTLKAFRDSGLWFSNPWRPRGDWNPLVSGSGVSFLQRLMSFMSILDLRRQSEQGYFGWTTEEVCRWAPLLRAGGVLRRGQKQLLTECPDHERDVPFTFYDLEPVLEEDAYSSLASVCDGYDHTFAGLCDWIAPRLLARFVEPFRFARRIGHEQLSTPPRLYVGTVHSVKGGEADAVYMFPDLSGQAARDRDSSLRCAYVGITRARQEFYSCLPVSPDLSLPLSRWIGDSNVVID
jgi:DNA polymerase III delta prime subunit